LAVVDSFVHSLDDEKQSRYQTVMILDDGGVEIVLFEIAYLYTVEAV
jgi:hypothetical protein